VSGEIKIVQLNIALIQFQMKKYPTSISEHRFVATPLAVFAGLISAQVIGTFQVGWSNRVLFNRLEAIIEGGYLAIPNDLIEPGLLSFKAAFGGGLFYTLTIGAFMSLVTAGWLKMGKGPLSQRKWGISLALAMELGALILLNLNGFNFFATAYILFVPFVVWVFYRKYGVKIGPKDTIFRSFCLICPPVMLALVWAPFLSNQIFIEVRDHVLLSNSPGRMINDYYYRYTLYPAESFKSLSQKQIRTFYLDGFENFSLKPDLTDIFVARDYFPVVAGNDADVIVVKPADDDSLVMKAKGRAMQVKSAAFFDRPNQTLQSLTDISDNNRWFRKLIYIFLVIGFPLLIYFILFGLVRKGLSWIFPPRLAMITASVVCMGIGLAILWLLVAGKSPAMSHSHIAGSSDRRLEQANLKRMDQEGIDPSLFPDYPALMKNGKPSERYWLARILGNGRNEQTYLDLIRLLDDPSPNVVCMALRSLGKRGNEQAIPIILDRMKNSDHWYIQWYAYKALKNLKWRQHRLN